MTSNIKRKPDCFRITLAFTTILAVLALVFCAFNALGANISLLVEDGLIEDLSGFKILSITLLDLMTGMKGGYTIETGSGYMGIQGPFVVNGLRAAFILLIIAILVAVVILYGILSRKFSYRTLKILAIANAVVLVAVGALILCVRPLMAAELNGTIDFSEVAQEGLFTNAMEFVRRYFVLGWGTYAAAGCAIAAAVGNIVSVIYSEATGINI